MGTVFFWANGREGVRARKANANAMRMVVEIFTVRAGRCDAVVGKLRSYVRHFEFPDRAPHPG